MRIIIHRGRGHDIFSPRISTFLWGFGPGENVNPPLAIYKAPRLIMIPALKKSPKAPAGREKPHNSPTNIRGYPCHYNFFQKLLYIYMIIEYYIYMGVRQVSVPCPSRVRLCPFVSVSSSRTEPDSSQPITDTTQPYTDNLPSADTISCVAGVGMGYISWFFPLL